MASPDKILTELLEGNKRFAGGQLKHPHQSHERIKEILPGQKPVAIVLGCSDSRVPPEIIFDQGLGDLFVIRVAGNILDDAAIGSIEYAVEHVGVRLVIVLGHSSCGAVTATVEGGEAEGKIAALAEKIQSAVEKARNEDGDTIEQAARHNVMMVVEELKKIPPILSKYTDNRELKVVGAYYILKSGQVELLK